MGARAEPRSGKARGNIFLVGLMGAGKTSMGKVLARRLGKAFVDCDHEIERSTGVKIPVIFEIEGEAGFRDRERRMLAELTRRSDIVLATGGGAVLAAENRRALTENGIVVYLRAAVADLLNRTRHDRNRPLLRSRDRAAVFERLFAERDPLYREIADIIVDTGEQSMGSLATRLEHRIEEFLAPAGHRAGARVSAR